MCMDADEMAAVLHSRWQRARMAHKCTECCRVIDAGERYVAERIVFDGSASSLKLCAHCMEVRDYLNEHCDGWVYTAMVEDIASHYWGDLANDGEARRLRLLALGARQRWRRADGSLWPVPASTQKQPEGGAL